MHEQRKSHGLFKYAPAGMMSMEGGQRLHICAMLTTAFEILHGKGLTPAAEEVVLTGNANCSYLCTTFRWQRLVRDPLLLAISQLTSYFL